MYGYPEKVKQDVKTVNEIILRQGMPLIIDIIAESVGNTALKFKLSELEVKRIIDSYNSDLKEAILERT